jgi:hypothetical protein
VFLAVGAAYATRWGFFGRYLDGPPAWCYALAASAAGVVFFLAPMLFGNAATIGGLPRDDEARPLVLYLRPFEVDLSNRLQLLVGASAGLFLWLGTVNVVFWPMAILPLFLNVTTEQRLHDALMPFGRLVAFGRPGARLQPVGAWRHRMGNEWQREILRYLSEAALVIVCPGTSPSVAWELEQVLERVPRNRLLFVLRFRGGKAKRQRTWDEFRARVERSLDVELPGSPGAARYLVLDAGGTPRLLAASNHPADLLGHFLWGDFNRNRLAPVLHVLGIDLPTASDAPGQRFLRLTVYLFAALLWCARLSLVSLVN